MTIRARYARVDRKSLHLVTVVSLVLLGCGAGARQTEKTAVDIQAVFTPSGWMGDGEYGRKFIEFSGADSSSPHSAPDAIKVTYTFGPNRWAGLYWQNEPDNWGDKAGNNYAGRKISKVTFWAKGEQGSEVVEFKTGGIDHPTKKHRDSFGATLGRQKLTREWRQYEISLASANLTSVIGGFCWVASADFNPGKRVTFYLDDLVMQAQ